MHHDSWLLQAICKEIDMRSSVATMLSDLQEGFFPPAQERLKVGYAPEAMESG